MQADSLRLAAVDGEADGALQIDPAEAPSMVLTRADMARELRVSTKTVDRLDDSAKLPRPVRIGACRRWPRATILEWIGAGCPDRRTFEAGRAK